MYSPIESYFPYCLYLHVLMHGWDKKKITTWNVVSTAVSVFNKSVTCIIENDNICTCQHASLFNSVHVDVQKEVVFWKMFSIFSTGISASCMRLSVAVNAKKIQLKTKKNQKQDGNVTVKNRQDWCSFTNIYGYIFFFGNVEIFLCSLNLTIS